MLSPPRATQSPDCSWVRIQHPLSRRPPASQVSYFPRGSSSKWLVPGGGFTQAPRAAFGSHPSCVPCHQPPHPSPLSYTHTHTHHLQGARNTARSWGRGATQPSPPVGRTLWVFTGASARRLGGWLTLGTEIAFPPGLPRRGRGSPALPADTGPLEAHGAPCWPAGTCRPAALHPVLIPGVSSWAGFSLGPEVSYPVGIASLFPTKDYSPERVCSGSD